jgi:ubiquinone/menaquinone biosynthesis C-methylase UbiE
MTSTQPRVPENAAGWAGYFDAFAPVYEHSAFGGQGLAYVGGLEVNAVIQTLRRLAPGRVLDAGAGTGRVARALCADGWHVTAFDVSSEMLDRLAYELPSCETVQGALGTKLPFDDDCFDAVVSMRVLKYVADVEVAVEELARVLRPGGLAVLEFANARSFARLGYRGAPVQFQTIAQAHALLESAGLRVVNQVAGTRLPYPFWQRARSARAARGIAQLDRAIGTLVGGDRTALLARSMILVGMRR